VEAFLRTKTQQELKDFYQQQQQSTISSSSPAAAISHSIGNKDSNNLSSSSSSSSSPPFPDLTPSNDFQLLEPILCIEDTGESTGQECIVYPALMHLVSC
jgi:hypothetical protein